jgi:hypothetical protein
MEWDRREEVFSALGIRGRGWTAQLSSFHFLDSVQLELPT